MSVKRTSVRLLRNVGTNDLSRYGLGVNEADEGLVVTVNDQQAQVMLKEGAAELPSDKESKNVSAKGSTRAGPKAVSAAVRAGEVAEGEEEEGEADTSPVSAENANEAIDQISRMRSREKLQEIVDTDERATVKKAAQERLDSL